MTPSAEPVEPTHSVSRTELFRVFLRIGLTSFGGPAGQIALMHRELVEKRRWLDESRYLHALQLCMLLPGPEAQQLATYVGFLLHGVRGAVVAGGLFILPGFVLITSLAAVYAEFGRVPWVAAVFGGIGASVIAVVLEALVRIGKRALTTRRAYVIALASFVALHFFGVPFPIVVLAAGLLGALVPGPTALTDAELARSATEPTLIDRMAARGELDHARPDAGRALRIVVACLALWAAPIALAFALGGADSVHFREGLFFSQAAVVTFGGAYAVLGWVAERAVSIEGWLLPRQMLDGLGLAETTPGPLVLVLTFVGFLGAHGMHGALPPLLSGLLGALLTTWVTFLPSFLFILVLAPYIESVRKQPRLRGALASITAAVLGVILHLSIWFAVHTLFHDVSWAEVSFIRHLAPTPESLSPTKLGIGLVSTVLLFRTKLGLGWVLALAALSGLVASLLGWH